jgi:hypothetical protein
MDEFRQRLADATRPGKPLFIDRTAATFIDGRGYRTIRAAASWLPGAGLPVTVATSSALAAAVLQAIGGSLIRVQPSSDRTVSPARPGPGHLAAEHHHLMTQHHNLRVLRRLATAH